MTGMRMRPRWRPATLVCAGWLAAAPAAAGEWGVNIYGLSYHWDKRHARQVDVDNAFNPGLGLRYRLDDTRLGDWLHADAIVDGGAYYDSGRNLAIYAGVGLLWPLGEARRVRLGVVVAAFHSDTYNRGDAFIAPVPLLTWRLDAVTLNLTHFPKIRDFNAIHTTGFFLTLPLR